MPYLGVHCSTCGEDTVPRDSDGVCLWCGCQVAAPAPRPRRLPLPLPLPLVPVRLPAWKIRRQARLGIEPC